MQFRAVVCSALIAGATALSTESSARLWLSEHAGDNPDDLSELKTENPDAYALVKALLTKRSLGLLDPKRPSASFSPAPPKDDDRPVGAAVYAKFATTQKEQLALNYGADAAEAPTSQAAEPYPEASGASHDWMNWKPPAQDDDAMVKNVLGAVADLTKGKSLRGAAPAGDDSSPLAEEAASIEAAQQTTAAVEVATTTAQPVAQDNSYLKMLDEPAAPAKPQLANVEVQQTDNALSSFSFDDAQPTTTTTTTAKAANGGSNPLASWLNLAKPHVQPAAAAPAEKPSNPYMMDLK